MYSLWNFVLFFLVFSCKLMFVESIECSHADGTTRHISYYELWPSRICEKTADKCTMHYIDEIATPRDYLILGCGTPNYTEKAVATVTVNGEPGHYCSHYVRSIKRKNETYNHIECYCDTDLCNSIGSPLHLEMQKIVKNVTKKPYTECHVGSAHINNPYPEDVIEKCDKPEHGCLMEYTIKYQYFIKRCNWLKYPKYTEFLMIENQTCIHDESEGIYCKCYTSGCNSIESPLAKEMLKMIQNVTGNDTSNWFESLPTTNETVTDPATPEVSSYPSISNSNGKGAANSESSKASQTPWKLIFLVIFIVTLLALLIFCICVFLNTRNNQPEEL